jgi:hypothetical protein
VPGLGEFLTQQAAKAKQFVDDAFNQKHGKEARNKVEWIGTLKNNAQSFVERGDFDSAVAKIEEARTKIAELNVVCGFYLLF